MKRVVASLAAMAGIGYALMPWMVLPPSQTYEKRSFTRKGRHKQNQRKAKRGKK